jgi:hypothetical protein
MREQTPGRHDHRLEIEASGHRGSGRAYGACVQKWESARTLEEARRAKAARLTDIGRG